MFLPENIYNFFEVAKIKNSNKPLVKERKVLYKETETLTTNNFLTSPLFILRVLGALILFITFNDFKKQKQELNNLILLLHKVQV